MNKENLNKNLQSTLKDLKEYFDLKAELYALIIFERISKMLSKFLMAIIMFFFLFFFVLFLSFGFVNWFNEATGTKLWGFILIAFFYLILGIIVFSMKKKFFLNPMLKGFTEVLFEKEETLDTELKADQEDEKN